MSCVSRIKERGRFATPRGLLGRWGTARAGAMRAAALACLLSAHSWDPARAQEADIFEIRGVPVDVTAETEAKAREQALAEGERAAFQRLLRRLTVKGDHTRLPNPSREEISSYVRDFSVAQEKSSSVRYIASLNIRFKPREVRNLLQFHSLSFAETISKPLLLLPVFQSAGTSLLWDDPNPWRDAWQKRPRSMDSLVPLVLPRGDLADVATLGAEQAVGGDKPRIAAMAGRYGTTDTLVAIATVKPAVGSQVPAVEVTLVRYDRGSDRTPPKSPLATYAPVSGESFEALLKRAAAELTEQLEDTWKRNNLLQFGNQAVMAVTIPVESIADWLALRQKLGGVAVINRVELVLISRDEIRANLHYIGEADQLTLALQQADLRLARDGDAWVLRPLRPSTPSKS